MQWRITLPMLQRKQPRGFRVVSVCNPPSPYRREIIQVAVLLQGGRLVSELLGSLIALDHQHCDGAQDIGSENHVEEQVDDHSNGLCHSGTVKVSIPHPREENHRDVEGVDVEV